MGKLIQKIGIYKIENKVNGKVYIGQSINIRKRFIEHRYRAFDDVNYYGLKELSKKYGVSEQTVYRWSKKYGVPLKGWNQERRLKYEQV